MKRYIAKPDPDNWYDAGTEVKLIDDYRTDPKNPWNSGLFEGLKNGIVDQEVCSFDEFDEIEESK